MIAEIGQYALVLALFTAIILAIFKTPTQTFPSSTESVPSGVVMRVQFCCGL